MYFFKKNSKINRDINRILTELANEDALPYPIRYLEKNRFGFIYDDIYIFYVSLDKPEVEICSTKDFKLTQKSIDKRLSSSSQLLINLKKLINNKFKEVNKWLFQQYVLNTIMLVLDDEKNILNALNRIESIKDNLAIRNSSELFHVIPSSISFESLHSDFLYRVSDGDFFHHSEIISKVNFIQEIKNYELELVIAGLDVSSIQKVFDNILANINERYG